MVSHEEKPFLLTAGPDKTKALISRLRESKTIDIEVETAIGTRYYYTVQHFDFHVPSAMFEGCAKALHGAEQAD